MARFIAHPLVLILLLLTIFSAIILVLPYKYESDSSTINLQIKNKKLVEPVEQITIKQGKIVTFDVSIDEDEQFHLEGYHLFKTVHPRRENLIEFEALTPGIFHIYLDKSRTYLTSVQIIE